MRQLRFVLVMALVVALVGGISVTAFADDITKIIPETTEVNLVVPIEKMKVGGNRIQQLPWLDENGEKLGHFLVTTEKVAEPIIKRGMVSEDLYKTDGSYTSTIELIPSGLQEEWSSPALKATLKYKVSNGCSTLNFRSNGVDDILYPTAMTYYGFPGSYYSIDFGHLGKNPTETVLSSGDHIRKHREMLYSHDYGIGHFYQVYAGISILSYQPGYVNIYLTH